MKLINNSSIKFKWEPPKNLNIKRNGSSIHWSYPPSEIIEGFELQICPLSKDQKMAKKWQSVCFIFAQNNGEYHMSLPLKDIQEFSLRLKVLHVDGLYTYFYSGIEA